MEALFGVQYAMKADIEINLDETVPTVEGRLETLKELRDQLRNRPQILTPNVSLLDRPQYQVAEKVLWKRTQRVCRKRHPNMTVHTKSSQPFRISTAGILRTSSGGTENLKRFTSIVSSAIANGFKTHTLVAKDG